MLGLFEVFCLCFIISCILSKCTETTNIIHSDSWQNVFSSHSWWPWERRSVHCRSKSVQTVFLISILVSHQRFYTRWYSNNQFLTVSSLLWFCPDRDHRKGVIKIIFLSRHGRMWACARGERRSREKQGRNPILSSVFVPFCSPRVALRKKKATARGLHQDKLNSYTTLFNVTILWIPLYCGLCSFWDHHRRNWFEIDKLS